MQGDILRQQGLSRKQIFMIGLIIGVIIIVIGYFLGFFKGW